LSPIAQTYPNFVFRPVPPLEQGIHIPFPMPEPLGPLAALAGQFRYAVYVQAPTDTDKVDFGAKLVELGPLAGPGRHDGPALHVHVHHQLVLRSFTPLRTAVGAIFLSFGVLNHSRRQSGSGHRVLHIAWLPI